MEDHTTDALVNRDEPVPVISAGKHNDDAEGSKPGVLKRSVYKAGRSLQDRIFSKILEQVMPIEDVDALMANNFRRFNARIGIVFLFQTRVERLLSWKQTSHTVSFLFIYSFICLDPHLLVIVPFAVLLFFVMVPAFLARHPPPPSTSTSSITPYYSYQGPALAPAKTIKPASETSKDFFRNMRDLQNCMADYSDVHDATVSAFAPLTNFSNEKLSSTVFLASTLMTALLFITAHLLPWRLIFLIGGNAAIVSMHPSFPDLVQSLAEDILDHSAEQGPATDKNEQDSHNIGGVAMPTSPSKAVSLMESLANISLDSSPEEREVEVFEIQYRSLAPYSESQWEHFLFSPMPYDPLSPSRIAGDRPKGCRFFEDVQPPTGWTWKGKKWELDLDCREWVVERMITGVGFEVSGSPSESGMTSGEIGGWVWDLPPASSRDEEEAASTLAYDDLDSTNPSKGQDRKSKKKGKERVSHDYEEKVHIGSHGTGEWRRRRWIRIVHRTSLPAADKYDQAADDDTRDNMKT